MCQESARAQALLRRSYDPATETASSAAAELAPPATVIHCDPLANGESQPAAAEAAYRRKTLAAQKVLAMIRHGDFEQLSCMLRCSKPDLNFFIDGQTALHHCLLFGRDVSWCKLLVLNGANPNLSNQDGWHPLHLAAFRGLKDTIHYLTSCNGSHTRPDGSQSPPPSEPDTDTSSMVQQP